MKCIMKTKCFKEKESAGSTKPMEDCLTVQDCFLERKNWIVCKMNSHNPKYRNRGNPYDQVTQDQRKSEERMDRIRAQMAEEAGSGDRTVIDG